MLGCYGVRDTKEEGRGNCFRQEIESCPSSPQSALSLHELFLPVWIKEGREEEGERVRCLKREESSSNSFASAAATTATLQERGGTEEEH